MNHYSALSLKRLGTCDERLVRVLTQVLPLMDHVILEGYRGKAAQTTAYNAGKSELPWPEGKHNRKPSTAVDTIPYPIDWKDIPRICYFAGMVMATAYQMGIKLRFGGDWDRDSIVIKDQKLNDLVHFELVET